MQLAASHVYTVDEKYWQSSSPVNAFITYTDKGCALHVSGADTDSPELIDFASMQEDLSCEEQLNYVIMTNDLNHIYQRIAYSQPLPLQCSRHCTEACLRFCDKCSVNWNTNWDGVNSDILYCPHTNCEFMVHACCAGAQNTCPFHAECKLKQASTQNNHEVSIVTCSGIIPVQGAWCCVLAQWPAKERCVSAVGLLHPIALAAVIEDANHRIARGQWSSKHMNTGTADTLAKRRDYSTAYDKKLTDALTELTSLSHVEQTGCQPDCWLSLRKSADESTSYTCADANLASKAPKACYPGTKGLGQLPTPTSCIIRLCATLERSLAILQVYHEPEFGRMCQRFRACGADVDKVLRQWLLLHMPLLPGEVQATTTSNSIYMHTNALNAILSSKTRERAQQCTYEPRHWCVTQEDAVLPSSYEADRKFMQQLGLSCSPIVAPEVGAGC